MSPKLHEFLVTLHRRDENSPWGIRLVGGSDLNAPLIITKVSANSPASEELLRGDVITKIESYDARDLTHHDAQRLFKQADTQIKLVVRRDDIIAVKQSMSNESSRCPSTVPPKSPDHLFESAIPNDGFPSGTRSPLPHGPHNYTRALMSPVEHLPHTVFPPTPDVIAEELSHNGASSDTAVTAEQLAHKQFNSPIGLYSDSNIESTIKQSVPIFIDLSFLEQKQKILEQQELLKRQKK